MKMPLFRKTVAAMIAAVAASAILPAAASTFTVGGSGNTFTVSRSGAGVAAAETVRYRTVPLSAFPGQHYTEKSGTLVFAPGQPSTNITVSAATLSDGAYMYQTNVVRAYRFEILDEGGFPITNATRDVSTGLRQFKADKVSKSVTDLVKFSGGSFSSGMSSGKYLDVSYTPTSGQVETSGTLSGYVLIDDSYDYAQKPASVSTAPLIDSTGAQADHLAALDYKIYATVCFTEKERDDGYQYLQIVAGTSSAAYDGADPNGEVKAPTNSVYKVCFELADGSNAEGKAFFPHRYSSGTSEFSLSTGKLWQQKYKDGYAAGSSGSVVLPVTTASITTRFDAGGDNDDTWGYKDFFVRMALVDDTYPTLFNNSSAAIRVDPGPHCKGNAFYISVPFNEIVYASGSKTIETTWGSAYYDSGDGSNVITFKGTITAAADTVLEIGDGNCNFRDLSYNYFQGSISKTFNGKTVSASHAYPITYDLGGGTLPANAPTNYTYDAAVSLVQPTRTGYNFAGWTGTDLGGPTNEVTVAAGSTGDRSYAAHWALITYTNTYDLAGGALPAGAANPETYVVTNAAFTLVTPVRTGYTFAGWTGTDLDGPTNEVTVAAGSTGDRSYVATWEANAYRVRFNDNDGSGATRDQEFIYDEPQSLDPVIARTGYYFAGWTGNADGSGDFYFGGQVVSNLTAEADGTVDLYAQWVGHSYIVRFDGNAADAVGNTDEMGMTYDVPDNLTSNGFTRTGYDFAGWSTNANGAVVYADGASVSNLTAVNYGSVMLYAQWTAHSYTVHFDPGGGEGSMPDQSFTYDAPQALSSNAFTRTGYAFIGWSVAGTTYPDGATVLNITNAQDAVVSLVAKWGIPVPYIDADGTERICADYTVLTNAAGGVTYGGGSEWYVVTNNVTISRKLNFADSTAHLILCDGATLAVTNANGNAIEARNLTIYGQTNGTGTVTAEGTNGDGIYANYGSVTINGGTVTATGHEKGIYANCGSVTINGGTVTATRSTGGYGIFAYYGSITLGWTNPTDSITASSYKANYGSVIVKDGQRLTDGSNIYGSGYNLSPTALAGKTLRPAYSISLPEGVVADGVVTQNGTTAYAIAGTNVTLSAAPGYYGIGNVTVDGVPLEPVAGVYSFAASADVTIAATVTPIAYSVRFDANGGEGSMPDQSFTYGEPQALSSNAFTRTGYAFIGWSVAGTTYPDGATVLNLTNAQDAVVSLVAKWGIPVPYIDAGGNERICADYTILTNAASGVGYGTNGAENWYVVTNDVTISGGLYFNDNTAHLILCDGATLAVTNANGTAIEADNLTIYGQTNGTGTVTANGKDDYGISASGYVTINGGTVTATGNNYGIWAYSSVTINGGTVTATGGDGIYAKRGYVTINGGTVTATGSQFGIIANFITLGWTNPTDSITASRYGGGGVNVKSDQRLTDGSNIYINHISDPSDLAGKTLRPAYSITLPEGVVASGVIRQISTTAYAISGDIVTLSAAPGYAIGDITVNGVPLADGTCSFTASADVTIAAAMTPVTYVVRFDAGGGEGSMPDQSFTYGAPQALTSNAFTRAGYTFAGWLGADGAIYPDGATVSNLIVRYIVRYADNKEDTWKRFDRMPYPGKTNDDYHIGDGALQNTENDNGLNLYTGFENSAWDPDDPYTAALISQNVAWFDEHDARNGVSMKLIEDFPNFYKEPVVVAQDAVVSLVAQWGIPYIDADGAERTCTDYTVITNATGDATYGEWGEEAWYVVTTNVNISGQLYFNDDTAHLILCDGATLTVTNANGTAIEAEGLTIYGQTNGTGTVTASGTNGNGIFAGSVTINGGNVTANGDTDIYAHYSVTINGGTVTAEGGTGIFTVGGSVTINGGTVTANGTNGYGIYAGGSIILGWTNPTDSITASSYYAVGGVRVKSGQQLTDGSDIYMDYIGPALAGVTLRPYIDTPAYPAYLGLPADPADDTEADAVIRANYDAWALRYGYDALGAYEAAFLLNVAPWATPIELRIAGIEMAEGGARVRVTCRAGLSAEALAEAGASAEAGAVDLSQINGVISVSAGDAPDALAPKAASGITYSEGEATIFVPASAGRFVKAVIGLTPPEE